MEIREDDLTGSQTVRFLAAHLENMQQITPPESVHALGVEALRSPEITLWSAWDEEVLLGCGALKALNREFSAAHALYTRYGFELRGPFGDYAPDPNSVFMAKEL
jgi:putative acetyltransferase